MQDVGHAGDERCQGLNTIGVFRCGEKVLIFLSEILSQIGQHELQNGIFRQMTLGFK